MQAVQKERQAEVSDYRPKIDHLVSKPSTRALIDKFVPQPGTMEARVADLLTELGDNDREENSSSAAATASITVQGEGLTRSDDDPEEAKRKLARLKSTRALLFYHERKRYQINKIKSKLYRKIRRKQRKNRVRKEGEGNEDNDGDSQDFEGDKEEERAIARARERATLRHSAMKLLKGHTGKWQFLMQNFVDSLSHEAAVYCNILSPRGYFKAFEVLGAVIYQNLLALQRNCNKSHKAQLRMKTIYHTMMALIAQKKKIMNIGIRRCL